MPSVSLEAFHSICTYMYIHTVCKPQGMPSGVEEAGVTPGSTSGSASSGSSRFSLRSISNRLRRVDDSYEARLAVATRELEEAEEIVRVAQKELQ